MNTPLEIERKLIPTSFEDMAEALFLAQPTVHIQQAYIVNESTHSVRVRTQDYYDAPEKIKAILCIKKSTETSLVRTEEEFDMEYTVASAILSVLPEEDVIIKDRYKVAGYDIDIFGGALTGLIVAEREFNSVEEAEAFVLPSWIKEDVTNDPTYINSNLIGKEYVDGDII